MDQILNRYICLIASHCFHSLFMALAPRNLSHSGLPVVVEESCIIIMILRLTWMTLWVLSYLVFQWMWLSKVTIYPLSLNINIIFSTLFFLHFLWYCLREFVQTSRHFILSLVIKSFFVMTCMFNQAVLLLEEIDCWSLVGWGFKG